MKIEDAARIAARAAGLSPAVWTEGHITEWADTLRSYAEVDVAETVLVALVSSSLVRPTVRQFQDGYREAMAPRLAAKSRPTTPSAVCDGSRFTEDARGDLVPCSACHPSLYDRWLKGDHHDRLSTADRNAQPHLPPACHQVPDGAAVLPPSAAIVRMVERGDRDLALSLAAMVIQNDKGLVRQRVDAALIERHGMSIPWDNLATPVFMQRPFADDTWRDRADLF